MTTSKPKFKIPQTRQAPASAGATSPEQFVAGGDAGRRALEVEPGRTRAKRERVAIAVRLDRDDWERASVFALKSGVSLQKLLVQGLSEQLERAGEQPLKGV